MRRFVLNLESSDVSATYPVTGSGRNARISISVEGEPALARVTRARPRATPTVAQKIDDSTDPGDVHHASNPDWKTNPANRPMIMQFSTRRSGSLEAAKARISSVNIAIKNAA